MRWSPLNHLHNILRQTIKLAIYITKYGGIKMFKMLKRALTVFLVIAVLAAGVPFFGIELPKIFISGNISANAAETHTTDNYQYTVSGSSATITGYSGSFLLSLSIPSKLDKYTVTAIGEKAFDSVMILTGITIPSTVTTIGTKAFYNCYALTKVNIGSGVTKIGDLAFANCTNLPSLTIPKSVVAIGDGILAFCPALTTIAVESGNSRFDVTGNVLYNTNKTTLYAYPAKLAGDSFTVPSGVTLIESYAFSGASKLSSVTLGSKVTGIGPYAFSDSSIKIIDMSDSSPAAIGVYAFSKCANLSTVTLPGSVSSVGSGAFSGCTSLATIVLSSKMDTIADYMFDGCKTLVNLSIPATLKSIGKAAFKGCSSMKGAEIPSTVTSIGDSAFENCTSLKKFVLSGSTKSLTGSVFSGCTSLAEFTVKSSDYFTTVDSGVLTNKAKTKLVCYPADKSGDSYTVPSTITSIGSYAFDSCKNLKTLTIPTTVTSLDANAVHNCSGLTIVCAENSAAEKYFTANKDGYSSLQTSGNSPALVVSSASGKAGSTVTVTVSIKNNPGLVATSFTVKYDATKVSLKKTEGTDLLKGFTYQSSPLLSTCKVTFADDEAKTNVKTDGVLVKLTFELLSVFTSGSTTVSLTVDENNTYNSALKEVTLRATNGTISIGSASSGKSGDVNGDGSINGKDATLLRRHIAGWSNIVLELGNADVNGDGTVNSKDATILRRYVAGWDVKLK